MPYYSNDYIFEQMNRFHHSLKYSWTALFGVMCLGTVCAQTSFNAVPAKHSGIEFNNKFHYPDSIDTNGFLYLWNGGGVAIGDVNNDDLLDLFFTGNTVGNRLYLNLGGLKFRDATREFGLPTEPEGWSTGVTMTDINTDGYVDIYVCKSQLQFKSGRNSLYINRQGKYFEEAASNYGLDISNNCTQATFFDADSDGDLDVHILTYPKEGQQYSVYRSSYSGGKDLLFINDNTKFSLSATDPMRGQGFGLGSISCDFDQNGQTDLYVANDLLSVDNYYLQSNGMLKDELEAHFGHVAFNSMGIDAGDMDNNGWMDIITVDMLPESGYRRHMQTYISDDHQKLIERQGLFKQYVRNMLQLNFGVDGFKEVGCYANIEASDWSWSPTVLDADNDGDLDLYVTTSLKKDFLNRDFGLFIIDTLTRYNKGEQRSRVYREVVSNLPNFRLQNKFYLNGSGMRFEDSSYFANHGWSVNSNGSAVGDLDNDGDVDIVLNNLDTTSFILQNMLIESGSENRFIRVKLRGTPDNPLALNSKVFVWCDGEKRCFERLSTRGFQSASLDDIHIGLKPDQRLDSIIVVWPNERRCVITDLEIGETITVDYADCGSKEDRDLKRKKLFITDPYRMTPVFIHKEDLRNDYKSIPILHRQLSKAGPGAAMADVNNDGNPDVYICGAKGQSGLLYLSDVSGQFTKAMLQPWEFETGYEESSALFADVDGDGDNDLIINSGGYEETPKSPWYRMRLYLNNGKGYFKAELERLPILQGSKSCLAAEDFDNDGDIDLFVGGQYSIKGYPIGQGGFLIMNDGTGHFVNVTATLAPELQNLGMVNSAIWSDHDGDGDKDLLLVGEWMAPQIFENTGSSLRHKVINAFEELSGLWNSVIGGDIDNDGDIDYVLGNLGENSLLKTSPNEPLRLYYPHLNSDSIPEPILTHYVQGTETVFPKRDRMIDQVLSYRKKFITYDAYASAPIDSIVGVGAPRLEAHELRSLVLLNDGSNSFKILPLPKEAQCHPVYGSTLIDIDQDEYLDLVLSGNSHQLSNEIGELNAGGFTCLLGNGDGTFRPMGQESTGTTFHSDVKSLLLLGQKNERYEWLASVNNGVALTCSSVAYPAYLEVVKNDGYLCLSNGQRRIVEIYNGQSYRVQQFPYVSVPEGASFCD